MKKARGHFPIYFGKICGVASAGTRGSHMFENRHFETRVLELLEDLNRRIYTMALDLTKLTAQEQRLVADVDTLLNANAAAQTSIAALQAAPPPDTAAMQAALDAITAALATEAAKVEGPGGTLGPASGPVPPTVPGPNQTTVLAKPASGGVGTQYLTGASGAAAVGPGVGPQFPGSAGLTGFSGTTGLTGAFGPGPV